MKLIIEISDESYDKALNGIINCKECFDAIVYGTPIPDNATVCDIDAIRREIEDLYIITNPASDPYDGGYYTALIDVRRIIDKHMKGEHDAT